MLYICSCKLNVSQGSDQSSKGKSFAGYRIASLNNLQKN